MKMPFYSILLGLLLPILLTANDSQIFVSGYVKLLNTGNPVENHLVSVKCKNQEPPFLYFNHTFTNEFGYFGFVLDVPFTKGAITVSTIDCNNQLIIHNLQFNPAQTSLTTTFEICNNQQTSVCIADYIYIKDPVENNKFHFKQTSLGNPTTWNWDFGDGTTSTLSDPVHYYQKEKDFEVCLTIQGDNGTCTDTYCNGIESNDDTLILARFTYYPVPGTNSTVQFYDLSLGNVNQWKWDFGDGRTSAVQNPKYTYVIPGTYVVGLTVTKPGNLTDSISYTLEVAPVSLREASFLTFPDPVDPMTLHFIDVSSENNDYWHWDFGNGQSSELQHPVHTYTDPGLYSIRLTTGNQYENEEDSFVYTKIIKPQPSFITLFEGYSSEEDPLTWRFTDLSEGNPDKWMWEFGDGSSSELKNPLHTYQNAGTYEVCLTVSDQEEQIISSFCTIIYADIVQDCKAAFTWMPDAVNPLVCHFTNASGPNAGAFEWDFGDGTGSALPNPTHVYSEAGLYRVCLTVEDSLGLVSDLYCKIITVASDIPLQSGFKAFTYPEDQLAVQFVNSSIGKKDITIWDFGDGTTSFEDEPYHHYSSEGIYEVCLHLLDSETGISDQFWKTITISSEPVCLASFMELPSVFNPLSVRFADLSSGEIVLRNWDFGDETGSGLNNPVHYFTGGGIYNVCLNINDYSGACSDEFCKEIQIEYEPLCNADFNFSLIEDQPLGVTFTDLSQGIMNTWQWDFGDGSTSSLQHPEHIYADSGMYMVTLSISHTDSLVWCNHSVSKQIYVFVPLPACIADFTAHPDSGVNKPNLFHFTDISEGQPDSWLWDFGDGTFSDQQNPSHQFTDFGNYQVNLTINQFNPYGPSCSDTKTIAFSSPEYLHIGGFVFTGLFPINNPGPTGDTAEVQLYRYKNNQVFSLDTSYFTEMGYYYALYLLEDNYLIKAQLTNYSNHRQDYFPTYFGDELIWQNADLCYIADSNHYHLDIHLGQTSTYEQGPGSISGFVKYDSANYQQIIASANTVVLLFDEMQEPQDYTFTGELGEFTFPDLPLGIYYLAAESAGKICNLTLVTLTEDNQEAKDIELEMKDSGATSVVESPIPDADNWLIFPNPVSDNCYIKVFSSGSCKAEIRVSDITGRTIIQRNIILTPGQNLIGIETKEVPDGIYFVSFTEMETGNTSTKKMIK
ncbi:MAG: PKD domain-containing protein [Sphingobacteriia bacterium]|nr:PKD domain-containing protein [Sphingobacteriia bacterium]